MQWGSDPIHMCERPIGPNETGRYSGHRKVGLRSANPPAATEPFTLGRWADAPMIRRDRHGRPERRHHLAVCLGPLLGSPSVRSV
jgi:hypothetical protein